MIQDLYLLGQKSNLIDEDLPAFKKLSLLEKLPLDSFENFLFTARFVPFTFLKVILDVYPDKEFILAYNKVVYLEYVNGSDDTEEISFGDCLYPIKLSSDSLVELIFSELGFSALDTRPPFINPKLLINSKGVVSYSDTSNYLMDGNINSDERIIMATDSSVILTKNAIYCMPEQKEKVNAILAFMIKEWKRFLREDVDVSVSHEKYISILMRLFSGRVRIRSISC